MRKFTTAAIAAATALSLTVVPANAQADNQTGNTNQNASSDAKTPVFDKIIVDSTERLEKRLKEADSEEERAKIREEHSNSSKAFGPLLENDAKNGWAPGLTFEIIFGVTLGAVALGLVGFLRSKGLLPF